MTRALLGIALSSVFAAMLEGCGSSAEPRFYTLSAGGNSGSDRSEKAMADYSVSVGPVTLPEIVDRPQLVVRVGANQVALLDDHRWAEPLRDGIPRVVAENLAQLLGARQVVSYLNNVSFDPEYRVLLDIQRFESMPGQTVTIDALWTVRPASGGEPKRGRSAAREQTGGDGYDALVTAYGRALATVSRDISEAIRSIEMAQPRQGVGK